ncbi:unnamed protein product [Clonostachys byssicola]|uniref:RlpA-like protein double-psi beta-barrel domain-containing protein n=1 Tax=Clonostachys byssicola TaxID=160290 RepID=A0A9N9Y304_9HYPO|nr:unnamed protein product [Clonostachys byssicola]
MKSAIALGLLAGAAMAKPHGHGHLHKRQVTVIETTVVEVTATILVAQDGARETVAPAVQPTTDAKFFEVSSSTSSPSSSAPPSTTSIPTTTSTTSTTSTSSTSSSSIVVIPSSSTYVAPIPTTSSIVIEIPTTTIAPIIPTTTSQAAAPTSSASAPGGGNSGATLSGDATFFTLGLGSCGTNYGGQDMSANVVAAAAAYYEKHPDACGKSITITAVYKGVTKTATGIIGDKCPECTEGSIDLSEGLFLSLFPSKDVGRGQVTWSVNE